ncbi:OmpA family protein [Desulfogranum marinum]|uniref:OmpA family protein n=1 Tax=Desulfogranum marinum TaxID=453220 RepID=UPI0019649D5E|nr:OmpA family protein [Desulfogranum marinum]MBM9514059.1 OmpA family protein [Desulfogranum marinum]
MAIKQLVTRIAISIPISMALLTTSTGANLEIRQEVYHYQMAFTQDVATETFVLSPVVDPAAEETVTPAPPHPNPATVAHFTNPITINFLINSHQIDPSDQDKMLSRLRELEVPQDTPLKVTGYTCQKGPDYFNKWLANERAKAVAALLKNHGYTVGKIVGKGDVDLISRSFFPVNRRVEITLLKN